MTTKIESVTDLMALLEQALLPVQREREAAIKAFQGYVFEQADPVSGANAEQWRILHDLALDLDYYEPDSVRRQEDPSFFDDTALEAAIREALEHLRGAR